MFNPREQATIIIIICFLIYALSLKSVRGLIPNLVKSFFKLTYHPIFIVIFLYIVGVFFCLYLNSIIGFELIKDYTIWILFAFFPLISKVVSSFATISIKDIFKDIFKLSVIPLFIMNEYTFPLNGEIFLVPLAVFTGLLLVVANTDSKYIPVQKLLNFFNIIIGLVVVVVALRGFITHLDDTKKIDFWQKMFIDIIGITVHLPLLFLIRLLCFYEHILIRTNLKNPIEKFLALFIIVKKCGFNISKLSENLKNSLLRQVHSIEDFKDSIL